MNHKAIKRTIVPLAVTGLAVASTSHTWAASSTAKTSSHAAATKSKSYKGPLVDMRWGPVQVTIVVKGKKIVNVKAVTNPDTRRSQFIDDQAVPMLKQEVLQAQSSNIELISGATMTSEAYVESLQAAITKAKLPNA